MLSWMSVVGSSFLKPEFWFEKAGSSAIFVVTAIIFAESGLLVGFFFPGDSLLFFTGFLTSSAANAASSPFHKFAQHVPALPVVLLVLFLAAVAGDQCGYWFGRKVGPSLFRRPNSRLFKQEYVAKAQAFFDKHGAKSVVLARFVPIVRTSTPVVAGVGKMPYRTYLTFDLIGGLLWAVGVTTLGNLLGRISFVRSNIEYAIVAVIAVSLLPVAVEVIRSRRHRDPVETSV